MSENENALRKPPVVYGGPYNQESSALTLESTKEKPEYEKLISGWKTVSQGALDFIAALKDPEPPFEGNFVENAKPVYENANSFEEEKEETQEDFNKELGL